MFSVFLSGYRNTCGCLEKLKKAVEILAVACVPTAFLVLPTSTCVSIYNSIQTWYMFSILLNINEPCDMCDFDFKKIHPSVERY